MPGFSSLPSSSTAPIAAFPLPPDLTRVGPRPALVPAGWVPPQALAPAFYGPGGAAPAGLREPSGAVGPDAIRDLLFQVTGYDRSWGEPPAPSGSLYAGMVWSPDRVLFEPQATMPPDHWYRRLNAKGVYVQAFQTDAAPSVWQYRYVRAGSGIPDLARPYTVLGGLSELYREQEIRTYEAQNQARGQAIAAYLYDSNENRMRRGESSPNLNQDYVVPEKYKAMEIQKAPVLLEMPMWTVINKASVTKMYKDAGLPVPTFPGEAAVASSQAFQEFKDTRGHVASEPRDFWYAEEQERQARVAARKEVEAEQEQARIDAIQSDERARLGAQGLGAVALPFAGDAPPGIPPAAARGLLELRGESAFDRGERRREFLHDLLPWGEGGPVTTVTEGEEEIEVLEVHDLDEPIEPSFEPDPEPSEPESTVPKAQPPSSTKTLPRPPSRPTPPPTTGVPRTGDAVVPDLLRKRWGEAKQLLKDFSPAVSGPGSDDAVVWSQHPTPGVKAPIGSPVLAVTTTFDGRENRGRAPGPLPTTGTDGLVSMPDVRLLPLEEAMKRLSGFTVAVKGTAGPGAVVVTQVPAGRLRVDRSAKVVLAVGALGRAPDGASFPGLGTGVAKTTPASSTDLRPVPAEGEDPCGFYRRMQAWAKRHPEQAVTLVKPQGCEEAVSGPAGSLVAEETQGGAKPAPRRLSSFGTSLVPDVVGLPLVRARATLGGDGFKVRIRPDAGSSDDLAIVGDQSPNAGTWLAAGGTVEIGIQSRYAPPLVVVPLVLGLDRNTTEEGLTRLGLVLSANGAGVVATGQEPKAGARIPSGSRVVVGFGDQVPAVIVPSVAGMSYDEAAVKLASVGLFASTPEYSAYAFVDTQEPQAGATVSAGSSVSVLLGVAVPDLVGTVWNEAREFIESRGLVPRPHAADGTPIEAGVVVGQQPLAGRVLAVGAGVDLVLKREPDAVDLETSACGTLTVLAASARQALAIEPDITSALASLHQELALPVAMGGTSQVDRGLLEAGTLQGNIRAYLSEQKELTDPARGWASIADILVYIPETAADFLRSVRPDLEEAESRIAERCERALARLGNLVEATKWAAAAFWASGVAASYYAWVHRLLVAKAGAWGMGEAVAAMPAGLEITQAAQLATEASAAAFRAATVANDLIDGAQGLEHDDTERIRKGEVAFVEWGAIRAAFAGDDRRFTAALDHLEMRVEQIAKVRGFMQQWRVVMNAIAAVLGVHQILKGFATTGLGQGVTNWIKSSPVVRQAVAGLRGAAAGALGPRGSAPVWSRPGATPSGPAVPGQTPAEGAHPVPQRGALPGAAPGAPLPRTPSAASDPTGPGQAPRARAGATRGLAPEATLPGESPAPSTDRGAGAPGATRSSGAGGGQAGEVTSPTPKPADLPGSTRGLPAEPPGPVGTPRATGETPTGAPAEAGKPGAARGSAPALEPGRPTSSGSSAGAPGTGGGEISAGEHPEPVTAPGRAASSSGPGLGGTPRAGSATGRRSSGEGSQQREGTTGEIAGEAEPESRGRGEPTTPDPAQGPNRSAETETVSRGSPPPPPPPPPPDPDAPGIPPGRPYAKRGPAPASGPSEGSGGKASGESSGGAAGSGGSGRLLRVLPERRAHILDQHGPGRGVPGEREFPAGMTDDQIIGQIERIANDPASYRGGIPAGKGPYRGFGTVTGPKGEQVRVMIWVEPLGKGVMTGFPLDGPVNPPR